MQSLIVTHLQAEIEDMFLYIWGRVKKQPFSFNKRLYILDDIHSASFEISQNICKIVSNLICPFKHLCHPF